MSNNFLGKLKDIIGGSSDYQDFEREMETIANQDLNNQENISDSFESRSPEMSNPVYSSSHFNTPEKSSVLSRDSSSSYKNYKNIDHGNHGTYGEQNLDNELSSNNYPSNVIGMPGVNNMVNEVVVIEPHSFDEIPQVIKTLKEQRSVVLNLNIMEPEEAQRAVDFVAGGTFAIDGHQERIGESIFLFTPRNVKVSTISGKSYKTNSDMAINSHNLGSSFSDSIWDEDASNLVTHLAQ